MNLELEKTQTSCNREHNLKLISNEIVIKPEKV